MCFFRKRKTEREKMLNNKHNAEDMAMSVDILLALAKESDELTKLLKDIQDKIKYFNPSMKDNVLAIDKKIANTLGDLKIEINKGKNKEDFAKAINIAKDLLDGLIVERTVLANSKK